MSYQVLVIPEDPTHNGDILEPLIGRMLAECGKPKAKVLVLANPEVQGYEHARQKLPEILDRYRHFDLPCFSSMQTAKTGRQRLIHSNRKLLRTVEH